MLAKDRAGAWDASDAVWLGCRVYVFVQERMFSVREALYSLSSIEKKPAASGSSRPFVSVAKGRGTMSP